MKEKIYTAFYFSQSRLWPIWFYDVAEIKIKFHVNCVRVGLKKITYLDAVFSP